MNTNYDVFTPEMVERYFQRSLFYGMFPGMFSHNAAENPYWQNPKWYNRDRPLFKKYLPVIKQVAEAGWQPVTGASCDNPGILVERFGPDAGRAVYLTLMNDGSEAQRGQVTLDMVALKLGGPLALQERVSARKIPSVQGRFSVVLEPHEMWAVRIASGGAAGKGN
jgi:hypothetical protein